MRLRSIISRLLQELKAKNFTDRGETEDLNAIKSGHMRGHCMRSSLHAASCHGTLYPSNRYRHKAGSVIVPLGKVSH